MAFRRRPLADVARRLDGDVGGPAFRLISYNIQRAIHLDGLLALLTEAPDFGEADVVAVQEATILPDGRNVLAAMAAALSPRHTWTYRKVMSYPGKEYGNGFLFRDDVRVVDDYDVPLPRLDRLAWREKRKTEGGVPDSKSAFVQGFDLGGRVVRIANVHLDFAGGWRHRLAQLDHLLGAMDGRPADPDARPGPGPLDVVCGDFNTVGQHGLPTTGRATERALQGLRTRGFADATAKVPFTSDLFGSVDPADPAARFLNLGRRLGVRFRQKTDHVLVRGAAGAVEAGVVPLPVKRLFAVSDHLPVWVAAGAPPRD